MKMSSLKHSSILKRNSYLLVLLLTTSLSSCDLIKMKEDSGLMGEEKPIARVKDIYLYREDLVGLVPEDLSPIDSTNRMTQFVNSWVRKQLIISEATSRLSLDEAEMERRLLDYKYALMIHEFQEQYVNTELNRQVSPEEIREYYTNNVDNFRLNQSIIKGIFVQLPKEAPNIRSFKRMLNSNDTEQYEDLMSYCHSYAKKAHLGDSSWVYFEQLVVNSPLREIDDVNRFLSRNKYFETQDENDLYFLKILEFRLVNEISPIEFVWEEIEKIILNKRKVKLVSDLQQAIYDEALKNKDFEIYNND